MTIATKIIRLFGEQRRIYQVIDGARGVIHMEYSEADALAWIEKQK